MSTPSDTSKATNGTLDPSTSLFAEQDTSTKKKRSRLSRIFKPRHSPSTDSTTDEPLTAAQKRRQQVYQAQKRHRDRHAEYVRNLEAEIAHLQHMDAVANSEKNAMMHQNNAIRDLLNNQSIGAQFDAMDISRARPANDDLSALGAATIDYRFDPEIEQERWFLDIPDLDVPDLSWASTDVSSAATPHSQPRHDTPVPGDSWVALDFILALEWPCRQHIHHSNINPDAKVPEACEIGKFHGHALTATQAIFQSAQALTDVGNGKAELLRDNLGQALDPSSAENWVLPHSEIDKLVELAGMLDIDDEFVTPAQAYAAVRNTVPNEKYLQPTLEALKQPLGLITQCQGFGAGMDAVLFWQHLESTISTLQSTRPDLA